MSSQYKLHFAHANGFPAGSYQQLFNALPAQYEVHALEKFGHNPSYPVNQHLHNQVIELIEYIRQEIGQPVYAVGHSMGAVVSYMAACEQPQWFKGVIMLDPPIASGLARWMFKCLKRTPLIDKYTPAGKASTRCHTWSVEEDLFAYFKSRQLFKNFSDESIENYVKAGVSPKNGKKHLQFDAQIEAEIYRNVPHNINRYYGALTRPAYMLTGQHTDVCVPSFISSFKRNTNIEHEVMDNGGHMFPLEIPEQVAQKIANKIEQWEG